jgi:thymidine phosphorylase
VQPVLAPRSGFAAVVDAQVVGMTSMALGAGRAHKDDPIDYGVGVEVLVKVGDRMEEGDPIFEVHANQPERLAQAKERLLAAVEWSDQAVDPLPLFYEVIE